MTPQVRNAAAPFDEKSLTPGPIENTIKSIPEIIKATKNGTNSAWFAKL
jgi:hypothetical protein